jgi:hypothetical protein
MLCCSNDTILPHIMDIVTFSADPGLSTENLVTDCLSYG